MSASEIATALPEIVLVLGAIALLMIGVFSAPRGYGLVTTLSVVLLAVVVVLVAMSTDGKAFNGSFSVDAFARFTKILVLIGSGTAIVMSSDFLRSRGIEKFEYPVMILLATTGMMMMLSANDLIALYIGLELQSLALYVIASIHRDDLKSTEAGLKYFVLGALSSGMLLYGASLIYGFAGTVSFTGIATAVQGHVGLGLVFGIVFLLAGLAFKISAVPFHMWTPDVYEGAPTPVTTLFAGAPKIAAMGLLVRVIITSFPAALAQWQQIVVFIAIASMALGSFAAIGQSNIKRLMAYSSIGHMGFALVGLAAGTSEGVQGVLIYLALYLAMTIGTFAVILSMKRKGAYVENVSDLAGLSSTQPIMAYALAALMFSLAGIPPLSGFWAKWYVFVAAVHQGLWPLAILGVLSSVVGAFYYLRIIKVMFFDEPAEAFEPMPTPLAGVLAIATIVTVFFIVWPTLVTGPAAAAAASLLPSG
ncbi:NADH-quinone oxidoreductase subunit NuoN [Labrys sp. LIt4]|uniref:NADH-quinone oxidoreductase subunit N n=1 Tax=Labrys okinawensis TaxID=346911 RepID=A0A2S9QBK1_9HYPH|nr:MULTISPECIES: NADH-quinone oxidoreductase subunit NuoN [Labrys]MBP0582985.1 NADH-quinone oxidoreductase subunit NuoN [Labrys sp. LIt4]PRH86733.1 NADH-quinone oxidoreductase subunit NuoN [Labrys okinawensis]